MTAAEKYQKGAEMERKGSSGAEIAVALGYASRQEWYDAKYHFKNKALTQRAASQPEDHPEPAPILEGLSCVKPASVAMKPATTLTQSIKAEKKQSKSAAEPVKEEPPQAEPVIAEPVREQPMIAAPKMLLIQRDFSAQGEKLQYRFFDGKVAIKQLDAQHRRAITLTRNDVIVMMMELHEMIMEVTR